MQFLAKSRQAVTEQGSQAQCPTVLARPQCNAVTPLCSIQLIPLVFCKKVVCNSAAAAAASPRLTGSQLARWKHVKDDLPPCH
jgi:hypothetical protein